MEVARPVRRAGRGNPPTEKLTGRPGPTPTQSIPPGKRKVYCAVVLDVFSRRVVGWSIDNSATSRLVTPPLDRAGTDSTEFRLSVGDY